MNAAIDIIKLDRLFFQGMLSEQRKRVIHNIIDIAKIKGIKVLAEGVETKEYARFVEAEGCDYIPVSYTHLYVEFEKPETMNIYEVCESGQLLQKQQPFFHEERRFFIRKNLFQ